MSKTYLAKAICDSVITSDEEAVLNNLWELIVKRRLTAHQETLEANKLSN